MCARDYQAHLPKFSTWVIHVSTEISAQSMASMIRMRQLARTPGLLLGTQARPVVSSQSIRMSSSSPAASYVRKYTKVKGEPIDPEVAANAPGVQALAARLQLTGIPANTLARALVDTTSNLKFVNNAGLAKFGKTLMSFHVYEHFMVKYPRLPTQVLQHIVDSYTGMAPLAEIGQMWGVQTDTRSSLDRYLSSNSDEQVLGRLSFTDKVKAVEPGVTELGSATNSEATDLTNASGAFVRAVVAAVYAHQGLDEAKKFIADKIIAPRKLDVSRLMAFSHPTRELAVLCARNEMEPPVSRLLAESGRYSSQAVFVVGVFSGSMKIGEGQGTSLREARTRAAVNALQGWYLYSPSAKVTEAARSANRAAYIDAGEIVI